MQNDNIKTLPTEFLERMKAQLGDEYNTFLAAYSLPPKKGARLNGLRQNPAPAGATSAPADLDGNHPYHRAGLYYIQEPTAMLPAKLLAPERDMRVLDLCAAPGGKTGALADYMRGSGILIANEPVKNRAAALVSNIERLGIVNSVATVAMPDALAKALPAYFDAVMVDAPCSGEGMFRKDANARLEWSAEHVKACAARQREILKSAAALTSHSGRIVYSTCTFSPEEDEENVRWFTREFPRFTLEKEVKLYPHTSDGEGHYAALLTSACEAPAHAQYASAPLTVCRDSRFMDFMNETFEIPPDMAAYELDGGRVALMPFSLPAPLTKLYILRAGVLAGTLEKGRFEPEHALFMAALPNAKWRREVELSLDDARVDAYLHGSEIAVDCAGRGFARVTVDSLPLGGVKIVDGVAKNRLPKGLRRL